ncbi:AbiH family protein [Flavobacterium litorale]|uniref:Bacteriophage abortive infection AbiH family protein n=1 Tax=Flavobacterium litorale TaxID=2856519 RepID=A0ABX8VCU0_9FLAO|nr:AbiH family protein [Flavobacterium litorale]QYJ68856.1 bacteriophage abortive infection AbiH family protein [Flavobacterium litorale]
MNRLVIIGNGFDLAHGLPTGYNDFMNNLWGKIAKTPNSYKDLVFINESYDLSLKYTEVKSYKDFKNKLDDYIQHSKINNLYKVIEWGNKSVGVNNIIRVNTHNREHNVLFQFNNSFFEAVNSKNYIQNWVDIENEYYTLLKDCLKEKDNKKVKKLNEEFEQVKNLLEEYLTTEVESKYELSANSKIREIFYRVNYETTDEVNNFYRELQNEYIKKLKNNFFEELSKDDSQKVLIREIKYLNFNYTSIIENFIISYNDSTYSHNQVHGKLNDKENPINFGFGDEMDDDYKTIEKKDDNEYLKNIKSFAYLNTPNYKNLIDFLESDKFQVYIMGHSCGLSDRILLNKVFEHKNCISIKIYYHQNEKGDNYTDIAQNVSRHFNKKEMMRERIVNKTYCEPLPQTKLPLK